MKYSIDINCDLGEGFGNYRIPDEKELLSVISSCNIACGFHAGDPVVISDTIQQALERNVKIGAHPSYPDLQGFGRRQMFMKPEELRTAMLYQVSALKGMVEAYGGRLSHVKPHGALYNHSAGDIEVAKIICGAIHQIDPDLAYMGMPNSCHQEAAKQLDHPFRREGFGDRKYNDDGMLVSRTIRGSVLDSPEDVAAQIIRMVIDQEVETATNKKIKMEVDTICIHGDNPEALQILAHLLREFAKNHIEITADK